MDAYPSQAYQEDINRLNWQMQILRDENDRLKKENKELKEQLGERA
jgi:regulator of replication initiation timing